MLQFKNLVLDNDKKVLIKDNKEVEITKLEFDFLEYLIINTGKILTRKEIIQNVWKRDIKLRTVDSMVKRIQDKIQQQFITCRPYFGYGLLNN